MWAPCMVSKDHGPLERTLNPPCYVCVYVSKRKLEEAFVLADLTIIVLWLDLRVGQGDKT